MEDNKKPKGKFWPIMIIAVVFGLLAGFVAQAFSAWYFFANYDFPLASGGLAGLINKTERARGLGQFFNYQMTEDLSRGLAGIYLKKKTSPASLADGSDILSQVYLPTELKGQGVILTSDGWLATAQSMAAGLKANQLVVVFEQKSYEVDKLLADKTSGVVFLHAVKTDNKNWPVVKLASQAAGSVVGQAVLALNSQSEIIPSNIKALDYQPDLANSADLIQSSDNFKANILIKDEVTKSYLGGPVINLGGEIVGLMAAIRPGEGTLVIPAAHWQNIVDLALQNQKIQRPYLGISYLDLSQLAGVAGIKGLSEHQLRRGALVYALAANSPGLNVLKKGDVILKVDDEQINRQQTLADLIQGSKPGEKVKLLILRQGVDQEVEVVLGEQ